MINTIINYLDKQIKYILTKKQINEEKHIIYVSFHEKKQKKIVPVIKYVSLHGITDKDSIVANLIITNGKLKNIGYKHNFDVFIHNQDEIQSGTMKYTSPKHCEYELWSLVLYTK